MSIPCASGVEDGVNTGVIEVLMGVPMSSAVIMRVPVSVVRVGVLRSSRAARREIVDELYAHDGIITVICLVALVQLQVEPQHMKRASPLVSYSSSDDSDSEYRTKPAKKR